MMHTHTVPSFIMEDIVNEKIVRLDVRIKDDRLLRAMDFRARKMKTSRQQMLIDLFNEEFFPELQAIERLDKELLDPVR
jgi:2-phosphoglycerate kinase